MKANAVAGWRTCRPNAATRVSLTFRVGLPNTRRDRNRYRGEEEDEHGEEAGT